MNLLQYLRVKAKVFYNYLFISMSKPIGYFNKVTTYADVSACNSNTSPAYTFGSYLLNKCTQFAATGTHKYVITTEITAQKLTGGWYSDDKCTKDY